MAEAHAEAARDYILATVVTRDALAQAMEMLSRRIDFAATEAKAQFAALDTKLELVAADSRMRDATLEGKIDLMAKESSARDAALEARIDLLAAESRARDAALEAKIETVAAVLGEKITRVGLQATVALGSITAICAGIVVAVMKLH